MASESAPKRFAGATDRERLSSWCWPVGPVVADGPTLFDPWGLPDFRRDPRDPTVDENGGTPLSYSVRKGGRIFITESHRGRLEVWPLFSRAGASGTIQIFGFDWWTKERAQAEAAWTDRGMIASPDETSHHLGLPYNILRDLDTAPSTLAVECPADAESLHLTRSAYGLPWVDRINGTPHYVGSRHVFNTAGFWTFFPWIVSVSGADTMTLLMRSI